jgi:hypothetical protein
MAHMPRHRHRFDAVIRLLSYFISLALIQTSTAADNTGVSIPYCSNYLCSRFPKTITAYFKAGCEGDFRTYLVSGIAKTRTATVPPKSLLVTVGVSIVLGVVGGYVVGRRIKAKGAL